jgi:hypothetical protein
VFGVECSILRWYSDIQKKSNTAALLTIRLIEKANIKILCTLFSCFFLLFEVSRHD